MAQFTLSGAIVSVYGSTRSKLMHASIAFSAQPRMMETVTKLTVM